MRVEMFVCGACHRKVCGMQHLLLTWATCQVCRMAAECVECAPKSAARFLIDMYRHTGLVDYPRKPKEGL